MIEIFAHNQETRELIAHITFTGVWDDSVVEAYAVMYPGAAVTIVRTDQS